MSDVLEKARAATLAVPFRAYRTAIDAALDELERAQAQLTEERADFKATFEEMTRRGARIAELERAGSDAYCAWREIDGVPAAMQRLADALNPTPPPSGKAECKTCGGTGEVASYRMGRPGSYPDEPCPDCAKPPEPEDLPHPGTGRLLSASPVKPPEPAQVTRWTSTEVEPSWHIEADRDSLRAQLAAAQARVKELEEANDNGAMCLEKERDAADAATERAEKAEREHLSLEMRLNTAAAQRDAERKRADEEQAQRVRLTSDLLNETRHRQTAQATAEALRAALRQVVVIGEGLYPADALVQIAREALAAHSKAVGP